MVNKTVEELEYERHNLYKTLAIDMRDLQKDMDRFISIGYEIERLNNEKGSQKTS